MNNNIDDFQKRKLEELYILNEYLNDKIELNNCNDERKILEYKNLIIKQLRNDNRERFYHHLTNNNQLNFKNELFDYNYTYERFNGFINVKDFANKFYNLSNNVITQTYFTNCGMTAIVSLLTSMCAMNEVSIDLLHEETYFETIKYISIVNKSNEKYKALYIDTIASDFSFYIDCNLLKKYNYVIIDSTCFLGDNFNNMISNILKQNIPCIIVRSHTKLDLVGTEYSHMGSVSFIYPNIFSIDEKEHFQNIEFSCKHLIGVYGACLIPENFPLFFFDKKLNELNKKRINLVSINTQKFYSIMKKNNINVQLPNHSQFCLIYLGNLNISLETLKEEIIKFCINLYNKGCNVYHAVSFGFDYIALDCYQNFIDKTFKIRVCLNDTTTENIGKFTNEFLLFLKEEFII